MTPDRIGAALAVVDEALSTLPDCEDVPAVAYGARLGLRVLGLLLDPTYPADADLGLWCEDLRGALKPSVAAAPAAVGQLTQHSLDAPAKTLIGGHPMPRPALARKQPGVQVRREVDFALVPTGPGIVIPEIALPTPAQASPSPNVPAQEAPPAIAPAADAARPASPPEPAARPVAAAPAVPRIAPRGPAPDGPALKIPNVDYLGAAPAPPRSIFLLGDADQAEIERRYRLGELPSALGRAFNCDPKAIANRANSRGWKRGADGEEGVAWTDERLAVLRRLYPRADVSMAKILEALNALPGTRFANHSALIGVARQHGIVREKAAAVRADTPPISANARAPDERDALEAKVAIGKRLAAGDQDDRVKEFIAQEWGVTMVQAHAWLTEVKKEARP